jgi:hypothetical protein
MKGSIKMSDSPYSFTVTIPEFKSAVNDAVNQVLMDRGIPTEDYIRSMIEDRLDDISAVDTNTVTSMIDDRLDCYEIRAEYIEGLDTSIQDVIDYQYNFLDEDEVRDVARDWCDENEYVSQSDLEEIVGSDSVQTQIADHHELIDCLWNQVQDLHNKTLRGRIDNVVYAIQKKRAMISAGVSKMWHRMPRITIKRGV